VADTGTVNFDPMVFHPATLWVSSGNFVGFQALRGVIFP
jgi:hypothetical protein